MANASGPNATGGGASAQDGANADASRPLRVGVVQLCSGVDRDASIAAAITKIDEAAAGGAQFVATPEMTASVDKNAKRLAAATPVGEAADAFSEAARRHKIWLLIGSMVVKDAEGRLFNRALMFSPDGETVARYDKVHMFDVDLPTGESWRESAVYTPGDQSVLIKTPTASIGLTICYDVRFPQLYRALAQTGAEIMCVPAAFTKPTGAAHWETLLRARAIENGAFVIAPGQGGHHEDGRETYGHSMIVDPWGKVVAMLENDAPGILLADIDLAKATEARRRIPNLALERRVEVVTLPS
ncbi:MAG: carbon-nitrogen hydrolase family protein [Pseudomonadota bacterium]